jgi:hypothetical protein
VSEKSSVFSHERSFPYLALTLAVFLAAIAIPSLWNPVYCWWNYGTKSDELIVKTAALTIRIRAYKERTILAAPGGHYEYCIKDRSSIFWQRIALFRLAGYEPIPADQVIEVTKSIVCFYHGGVFGITTDSGASWNLFGGYGQYQPLVDGLPASYDFIEAASMTRDGTGTISLTNWTPKLPNTWDSDPSVGRLTPLLLRTTDFGAHWKLESSLESVSQ